MLRSLSSKLIFFLFFLQLILFLSVYFSFQNIVDKHLEAEEHRDRIKFEQLFNASIAANLFAEDYVEIQNYLQQLIKLYPHIIYIEIRDIDNRTIAKLGDTRRLPKSTLKNQSYTINLQISDEPVGSAMYVSDEAYLEKLMHSLLLRLGLIIAALGIIGILLIYLATRFFTRGLTQLHEASAKLAAGEQPEAIITDSKDEIGELSRLFNKMVTSITNRTRELSLSEEKYRLAMDAAQDGIWDWDISSGKVDYSGNWANMLGETQVANEYSSWGDRIHPDDKPRTLASLDQHLKGLATFWLEEHRLKQKNGDWKWVLGRGRVVERDTEGRPLRMVGTMIDISRQKKLEEELQQHRSSLELLVAKKTEELLDAKNEAERANHEKSEFLANMSHELRTPMHSILSFASLALKRVEDEKVEKFLQNIRTSGIRLTDLLNDLLDLSKLESGKLEGNFVNQDMTTLIEQTISEISSLLSDKNIKIKLNTEEHFDCSIDQQLIMRVLINLFSNAIKFSSDNSVIQVNLERKIKNYNGQRREVIEVSVFDEGVGIPGDQLEDIFNKFIQSSKTKSQSGGTGLGLSISKEIIELHGGKIWAESPPQGKNKGSAFTFFIPVNQA